MIKNERQYRITKSQADKFAEALRGLRLRQGSDPLLLQLESDAIESQLDELRSELENYERLQAGESDVIVVDSFDELPQSLVKARIALGLSQKDLADRLGMKEQQIQRYESTDYQSASMSRLRDVVQALGVSVREEVFLPNRPINASKMFQRLNSIGIDRGFLLNRVFAPEVAKVFEKKTTSPSDEVVCRAAATVSRVFGWQENDLFGSSPLRLRTEAAGMARFKLPTGANQRKVNAYTVYAHYLALLVLQATPDIELHDVPVDAFECRQEIISSFGEVTFSSTLAYLWQLGIPVLPLNDSGAFHGAFWRVDGRNVVVLKQQTKSLARWQNDLLHELYHAGQEPEQPERSVIEASETSPERRDSDEEQEATVFAADVALDGRAEDLAHMCIELAGGRVESLKSTVTKVAEMEEVDVGSLANYLAFRLSLQDVNWWGAATNLQMQGNSPWEVARDWLMPRIDLSRLNAVDRQILMRALSN